jgi:PIN domain nuclease of toxin-antitoxin system
MRLLLDTNALIFLMAGGTRFSRAALHALNEQAEASFISRVSLWEIGTKFAAGRLSIGIADVLGVLPKSGLRLLPIEDAHLLAYQDLPRSPHHRDPFDRMLVAQAQSEGLTLLTRDAHLAAYAVPVIPA